MDMLACAWSWIIAEAIIAIAMHRYLSNKGHNLLRPSYFTPRAVALELRILMSNLKKK